MPYSKDHSIGRPDLDNVFLKARAAAGMHIQKMMDENKGKCDPHADFRWIKPELSWPSFDDLTFAYRNKIFSVLVAYCLNEKDEKGKVRFDLPFGRSAAQFDAAVKNDLVPCVFPIYPDR